MIAERPQPELQTPERVRVLAVEDNPHQVSLLQDFLLDASAGRTEVELCVAGTIADASAMLGDVDVVLLDLNLPDSSDLQGLERLHAIRDDVPIVVLTNVDDESLAVEAGRCGAFDFLLKREISAALLLRTIRYAVHRIGVERRLRESEERYGLAVAGANDGIWDWVVGEDRIYLSATLKRMIGLADDGVERVPVQTWLRRVDPRDLRPLRAAIDSHLAGDTDHLEHEHRIITRNRKRVWMLVRGLAVRDGTGRAYRMAGSLTDITERKHAEAQLVHGALHDALTELPNRALLMDRLDQRLRRYLRDHSQLFAVMFLDLDWFKSVNDTLGHAVGDALLVAVARRLSVSVRPEDTLARLSGDEFAILLGSVSGYENTVNVAGRILALLDHPFEVLGHEVHVRVSVGAALGERHYTRPEELLRDADLAMYQAKSDPTIAFKMFDAAMRDSAVAQHRLETDLRRAVEQHELVAHYQPIVSLETGAVQGFEALMRWRHPRLGTLLPESFLHVAEETGAIVPMSWWILEEALVQLRHWQTMFPKTPPLTMSINISGKLFGQPDVLQRLDSLLERVKPAPDSVHLEITETTALDHGSSVLSILDAVRALGVRLHIDDFGTGYASLTYLQRFCYDTLKIDRSFVASMVEREDSGAIVKALVALADSLGMTVIAEGVESDEQLHWLQGLNCQQAQGYLFARPMDPRAMAARLSDLSTPGTDFHLRPYSA